MIQNRNTSDQQLTAINAAQQPCMHELVKYMLPSTYACSCPHK